MKTKCSFKKLSSIFFDIVLATLINVGYALNSTNSGMIRPLYEKYKVPPYLLRMVKDHLKDRPYNIADRPRGKEITARAV